MQVATFSFLIRFTLNKINKNVILLYSNYKLIFNTTDHSSYVSQASTLAFSPVSLIFNPESYSYLFHFLKPKDIKLKSI